MHGPVDSEVIRASDSSVATSDLGLHAARAALADATLDATEIDCIIFGTFSPDFHFPGTGVLLQKKLGIAEQTSCACFDIRQQCSGFVYGLQMADAFVKTGVYKRVLLVDAVPLTIDHWRREGRVQRGDRILSSVFGSGFTWGAALFTL